jgi:hypothetical protein
MRLLELYKVIDEITASGSLDDDGYEQWEPEHGIDNFVRTEFSAGGCYDLATALHQQTGWPIWGTFEKDHPDMVSHVWVIRPDGKAVDINGIHSQNVAKTKYDNDTERYGRPTQTLEPRQLDASELSNDPEMVTWATELIQTNPEHFGISHPMNESLDSVKTHSPSQIAGVEGSEGLEEAFDSAPSEVVPAHSPNELLRYEFTIDDNTYMIFMDGPKKGPTTGTTWEVSYGLKEPSKNEFGYNTKTSPTNTGNAGKVFSTLIEFLQDFIHLHGVEHLIFTGSKDSGLVSLYNRMLPYFAKRHNYEFESKQLAYSMKYTITIPDPDAKPITEAAGDFIDRVYQDIIRLGAFTEHGSSIEEFIDEYSSDYESWWDEEKDSSELMKDPVFLQGFKDWLGTRFKYVVRGMRAELGSFPHELIRAMYVTDQWNPQTQGVGKYWSTYRAEAHQGDHTNGTKVILTALINNRDINWEGTIRSRMDYMHGDVEGEIQLKPNANIQVTEIEGTDIPSGIYPVGN